MHLLAQFRWLGAAQGSSSRRDHAERGLRRLLDMLATQAILSAAAAQGGGLPPHIMALLQGWQPPQPDFSYYEVPGVG